MRLHHRWSSHLLQYHVAAPHRAEMPRLATVDLLLNYSYGLAMIYYGNTFRPFNFKCLLIVTITGECRWLVNRSLYLCITVVN